MQDSRLDKSYVPGGSIDYGKSAYRCLVPVVIPPIHIESLRNAGFSVAGLLPSAQVPSSAVVADDFGWNRSDDRASRAVMAPEQSRSSASSTVLSHCDGNDDNSTRGNSSSNRGGSVLKEHDYIGLTEVSSSPGTMHASKNNTVDGNSRPSEVALNLEETDLRLGLGPPDLSHATDARPGAHAAFSPAKGFGSSPDIFSDAKQVSADQMMSEAKEKAEHIGYDHFPCKEGGTRLLGHDSLETSVSSCEEVGVAVTEDASDKRSPVFPVKAVSTVWPSQARRNEERIGVCPGSDFSTLQAPLPGREFDVSRVAHLNGYATSRFALLAAKNGVKRAYDEAMVEKRFNYADIRSCSPYDGLTRPTAVGGGALMLGGTPSPAAMTIPDTELKRFSQQTMLPQNPYVCSWGPVHPSALGNFGQFQPLPSNGAGGVGPRSDLVADLPVPPWEARSKAPEAVLPVERCPPSSLEKQQSSSSEVSPQKGQVVGWPPIGSFRKNSLASPPKPVEGKVSAETPDTGSGPAPPAAGPLFVKVNMDGIPIGRKVDLTAYNGYESLILALEEMFQRPHAGQGAGNESIMKEATRLRLINGTDFMLIYEDKEGDWMLVGDVPWGMFISAVRRLWITKASDATGLVPRDSRNTVSYGNARSSVCT